MKRLTAMLLAATAIACGPYSSLNGDGTGPYVCGEPGQDHQAGFSFIDCSQHDSLFGATFSGRTVAAGSTATVYIDHPNLPVTGAASSDDTIARFALQSGKQVLIDARRAGSAVLSLSDGSQMVDQAVVNVAQPDGFNVLGAPSGSEVALYGSDALTLCGQPTAGAQALDGAGLVHFVGEGDVEVQSDTAACSDLTLDAAQGDGAVVTIGASGGSLTMRMGASERTLTVSHVAAADLDDVQFTPSELHLRRDSDDDALVRVTVLANGTPVMGAACTFQARGLSVQQEDSPLLNTDPTVNVYSVSLDGRTPESFSLSCVGPDGRVLGSIPVTVNPD